MPPDYLELRKLRCYCCLNLCPGITQCILASICSISPIDIMASLSVQEAIISALDFELRSDDLESGL